MEDRILIANLGTDLIPPEVQIERVIKSGLLSDRLLRRFAAACARRALWRLRRAGRELDQRSWNAVRVARRCTRGEATKEDLCAAWNAAVQGGWYNLAASLVDAIGDAAVAVERHRQVRLLKRMIEVSGRTGANA